MEYSDFKSLLNSRKVTLKSIAGELGMSHQNLSKLIQDKTITEERITILCDLLSISPNEFFGYSSNGIASCRVCEEKDKRIAVMEKYIKSLEDQIALLKGVDTKKEKRKAV